MDEDAGFTAQVDVDPEEIVGESFDFEVSLTSLAQQGVLWSVLEGQSGDTPTHVTKAPETHRTLAAEQPAPAPKRVSKSRKKKQGTGGLGGWIRRLSPLRSGGIDTRGNDDANQRMPLPQPAAPRHTRHPW